MLIADVGGIELIDLVGGSLTQWWEGHSRLGTSNDSR